MDYKETLGAAIKMQLYRMGKTQKWLASEVGVSANHITQVVTNKSRPSLMLLISICKTLNLEIQHLTQYVA